MTKNTEKNKAQTSPLDDETSAIDAARGKESKDADYDRNVDGLYGGSPKVRQPDAPAGNKPRGR